MTKRVFISSWLTLVAGALFVASAAQAEEQQSVYGALYNSANLVAADGFNEESVLFYYPQAETEDEQGFIALTTNDNGIEWYTFDPLGLESTLLEDNPLDQFNCRQPGRHSPIIYNGEYYFGAACQGGAMVFKLTGIDSAEQLHVTPDENQNPPPPEVGEDDPQDPNDPPQDPNDPPQDQEECNSAGYPTSTVVNDKLVMFYNCGFAVTSDGTTWTDVTDALNQPQAVPLEATDEVDGVVYLAFTDGSVWTFDGESYNFLAQVEGVANLPAIGINENGLYVGDMVGNAGPVAVSADDESETGATLYKYNEETGGFDVELRLDANNTIINKMSVDENGNIVFFTANALTGSNGYVVDGEGKVWSLFDSGLGGGENPQNNAEVVSIAKKEVVDNGQTKYVMAFTTKNQVDQTKVFVLNLGDLAVDTTSQLLLLPNENSEVSGYDRHDDRLSIPAKKKSKRLSLKAGQTLKVRVPKKQVRAGDVFSLLIDDEAVASKTAKKRARVLLKYGKTKQYAGQTVGIAIAVRRIYGDQVSVNEVQGNALELKITKKNTN